LAPNFVNAVFYFLFDFPFNVMAKTGQSNI